jgi:hypothetical protein
MNARTAIVFASCMSLVFFVLIAGCICSGQDNRGPSPSPTASPGPKTGADLAGWGTDGDVYARNATATGWVNVTNTGSEPIDEVDFIVVIKRTVLFIPVEKTFSHNATGLGIRPGETEKVQFSVVIPAEYSGVSTAGDYQYTVTASVAGREIGSFTKPVKVT